MGRTAGRVKTEKEESSGPGEEELESVREVAVVVKLEKEDSDIVSCSSDDEDAMQSSDEDDAVAVVAVKSEEDLDRKWQELKKEEDDSEEEEEEEGGWADESLVKDEESDGEEEEEEAAPALTAKGKGKRKGDDTSLESPTETKKKRLEGVKKEPKAATSKKKKKTGKRKKRTKDDEDDYDDEEEASPKKKAKKKETVDKKKKKKAKKKPVRRKRKAPAARRRKKHGKGDPSDDSDSSSSDSEADQAAGIKASRSSNQVVFPLKRVAVGSWVRDEQGPLALKWRLRNEGTKNSEISIEMKNARSKWEAGKRMIFRRLEIDRIKMGRKREGNLVLLTFELTCPPIFERFMPLPGARGNKWVRTSDFTKGDAQAHKRVRLLTTGEAAKKFFKLTKRWTKPILVRSLRDRPQLYWHAMLSEKMTPAAQPKLETPDSTPPEDVKKPVAVHVKSEIDADAELNIHSLPEEVLMQIVGYMDAKHVLQSVSLVNRTFHNLSNDELLWKSFFRRFCGSLVYSVEEAAWDTLPSQFASWKEALATTNAMCFFRCAYCGKRQTNGTAGRLLGCIVCDECETSPYCPSLISRTRASKRFGLKDEDLVASPLRRLTKYNMHAAIVRWFIMDEVASFAKSLTRAQPTAAKAKPPPPLTDLILIDDDDDDHGHVGSDVGDEEDGAEEIVPVPEDHDDDNDFQETIVAKKKKKEKEEKKKARKLLMEEE